MVVQDRSWFHLSRSLPVTKIRWRHLQMIFQKHSEGKCKWIPLWLPRSLHNNSDVLSYVEPAESQFCPTRATGKTESTEKSASHHLSPGSSALYNMSLPPPCSRTGPQVHRQPPPCSRTGPRVHRLDSIF